VPPSSTSSSDADHDRAVVPPGPRFGGFPLAGLLAAVLVLSLDALAFGDGRLWSWLGGMLESRVSPESGIVRDRLAFSALAQQGDDRARGCVIGTSRARRGLLPYFIRPQVEEHIEMAYLAHAGMQPFEVRALSDEIIGSDVDVVVLSLSEFDTHRPLTLSAATSAGSVTALFDLLRLAGVRFALRERETLLRLSVSAILKAYRFRSVERAAGLGQLLAFSRPDEPLRTSGSMRYALGADGGPGKPQQQGPQGPTLFGIPLKAYNQIVEDLGEQFPDLSLNARRAQLRQILSISNGVHADVQMELLAATVSRLTEAGIDVLLFELPLLPSMRAHYDSSTRDAFHSFARSLDMKQGVHFVSLELSGPIHEDEFFDMTHVTNDGSERLSAALSSALLRILDEREAR